MDADLFLAKLQEASAELAGIKAYEPDRVWVYKDLEQEIFEILCKHLAST